LKLVHGAHLQMVAEKLPLELRNYKLAERIIAQTIASLIHLKTERPNETNPFLILILAHAVRHHVAGVWRIFVIPAAIHITAY